MRRATDRMPCLMQGIGLVVVAFVLLTVIACGSVPLGRATSTGRARTVGSGDLAVDLTATPAVTPSPTLPQVDGSLGDANTRLARTLLTKAEIEVQFGGPVSDPIPVYPTCRWEIGTTAFVSVLVAPGVPLDAVPSRAPATKRASAAAYGLGPGAYFGINRILYFANDRASYWVSYQEVADYISIAADELGALAQAIRAKPLPVAAGPTTRRPELSGVRLGPPTTIQTPTAQQPLRVFFAGDSMAAGPSWGLYDVTQGLSTLQIDAEYQVGSGMVRDDYFDWYRHLAAIVAGLQPQVLIWQAGGNDRQPIRVNGELARLDTPAWDAEYRRRVDAYMATLTAGGCPLVWIGLPPMEDGEADAFARHVNQIYRDEAARHGSVTYLDAYPLFAGPGGGYAFELPVFGSVRPVRTPDGIHLNMIGSRRLARAILVQLNRVAGTTLATSMPTQ